MTFDSAYPAGFLLSRMVEHPERLSPEQSIDLNLAARNLLAVTKEDPRTHEPLFNAASSAICRTYSAAPVESHRSIREMIEQKYLGTYGYIVLPAFAREGGRLLAVDPLLLQSLYEAAFAIDETSEEPTIFGGPVFALRGTRKQNIDTTRWSLGQLFKPFLEAYPRLATETLMVVLDKEDARTRPASYKRRAQFSFIFNGTPVHFFEDSSGVREQFGAHDVSGEMLDMWVAEIGRLAAAGSDVIDEIVSGVARVQVPAAAWLKLLREGATHPDGLGDRLRALAWQPAILLSDDTAAAGRQFLASIYPRLTAAEKATADETIIKLPTLKGFGRRARLTLLRDWIIDRIPQDALTAPELLSLRTKLRKDREASDQALSIAGPTSVHWPDLDSAPTDVVSQQLSELLQPVTGYAFTHLNDIPDPASARNIFPALRDLAGFLRGHSEGASVDPWIHARRQFAEACAILARTKNASVAVKLRDLVLPLRRDIDPALDAKSDESVAERGYSAAPGVRGHVAAALGGIASQLKGDTKVRSALGLLAVDSVAAVRREVVAHIGSIALQSPDWAWRIIGQRVRKEANNGVLLTLVQFTLPRLAMKRHSKRVSDVTGLLFQRAQGIGTEALRKGCTGLLLRLAFNLDDAGARRMLDRISAQPLQYSAEIAHAAFDLRGWLVSDGSPWLDHIARLAWGFLAACVTAAEAAGNKLDQEYAKYRAGHPRRSLARLWGDFDALHRVIAAVGDAMFFASGAFQGVGMSQGKRDTVLAAGQRKEFLAAAGPLLDALASFGLPPVAHHLAEICAAYLEVDPRGNLLRLATIVRAGRNNRYESDPLAAGLIVRLMERYLAEYRHLFTADRELRSALREILETFVGWPAALQLIYRLDDLSR
jgi:hypothetical protein